MTTIAVPDRSDRARQRLFTTARCRYAEDCLADAVSTGIRQLVLHGRCLDTFARHNPYPHVRVFDIQHPHGDIEQALAPMDFDPRQPSFIIWLEAPGTLAATLRHISGLATGTQVVFDHTSPVSNLVETLDDLGLELLDHLDSDTIASRYLELPRTPAEPGPGVVRAARR
ncbi:hypothetical protein HLB23_02720 [Nocardia uniformis]|uniref:Uncharacterized protein n=1 Tax=Nocardia uniformis TaxID=53432 RepID=A0A849BYQ0_9NOCA|nr:class I SAM-dependent methyltransferase [Nocardia uniformis]NNH68797.1 hypothetical protein [Nocardia uniformis]